jgi:hypothetical protein
MTTANLIPVLLASGASGIVLAACVAMLIVLGATVGA